MPRLNMPVVVSAFNDPTWGLILVYADGRMARQLPASKMWVAMDGPDYHALWPAPAPVADQFEYAHKERYGRALGGGAWACCCGSRDTYPPSAQECPDCKDRNPRLRPGPESTP